MPANPNAVRVLETSNRPRDLARAAQELASSKSPDDHKALFGFLTRESFRSRIDPPDEVITDHQDLMLARPIRTLEANTAPSAVAVLVGLTTDPGFIEDDDRVDVLIDATAAIRPPPQEVIDFWKGQADPVGTHLGRVVRAAAENGSPPAWAFFGTRLADDKIDAELRIAWMRRLVLERRTDATMLAEAERLVSATQPPVLAGPLKRALVEALFDFRRAEWYRHHTAARPPDRAQTSRASRDCLRRIAAHAREHLEPGPDLEAAIVAVLAQFDAMDKSRAP